MVTLLNSDCIAGIRSLPDGYADLVICDAPYGIAYVSGYSEKWNKNIIANDATSDVKMACYRELARAMKADSFAVCFCSFRSYAEDYIELSKHFKIANALIWNKGGGGMGDLTHTFATDYEIAILCAKGAPVIRGRRDGSVMTYGKVNSNDMIHPTEKPIKLMEYLVTKLSDKGDMVLDPFAGSCCVGAACQNLGRNYLGYEIDPKFYEAGRKRLEGYDEREILTGGGQMKLWN
jgi:site-specific DNA-methyltransferase (adenine-specific)